jgi:hypothetical protein
MCRLSESELLALVKVGLKQNNSLMDKPTSIHVKQASTEKVLGTKLKFV